MPNVLEVQIIGDVSALEKSLKQAEKLQAEYTSSIEKTSKELAENIVISRNYAKAIEELDKELKSGSISSKEYSSQLAKLKKDEQETTVVTGNLRKELANLKREQKDLGAGIQKDLTPKVANGGNALMQFSRIAQDAPFGIVGIGNNITATVEAFGHLQKQTGSTGEALKAVASSMLGSGGILLAVSLVTTGLTYMAQNGLSLEDVFDKLNGTFDENAKALSDINKEAAKTSGEEIATMKGLVSAAQDKTLADEKRLLAVENLQKTYPAYFGNLTQEQILNGDVSKAVDDVSRALRERARATAIAGKLGENAAKRLELEEKREQAILDIQEAQKNVAYARQNAGVSGGQFLTSELAQLGRLSEAYRDIVQEINNLDAQSRKFSNEQAKATKKSIGLLAEPPKTTKTPKAKTPKAKKEKKDTFDAQKRLEELNSIAIQMEQATEVDLFQGTDKTIDNLNKLKDISQEMAYTVDSSFKTAQKAGQVFSEATSSAIHSLGSEIASSLQTGNAAVDAFTGSIIQSLADIASAQLAGLIAQQAIAAKEVTTSAGVSTAKGIESATKTAAASGPAAAFVLPALVGAAIGFIAASFAGIKFAHGGVVPGGSFTGDKVPAMLNSGETVMNRQQQANTLMAIANGNSNSLQGNRIMEMLTTETKLRGSDLLLIVKREEKKR